MDLPLGGAPAIALEAEAQQLLVPGGRFVQNAASEQYGGERRFNIRNCFAPAIYILPVASLHEIVGLMLVPKLSWAQTGLASLGANRWAPRPTCTQRWYVERYVHR